MQNLPSALALASLVPRYDTPLAETRAPGSGLPSLSSIRPQMQVARYTLSAFHNDMCLALALYVLLAASYVASPSLTHSPRCSSKLQRSMVGSASAPDAIGIASSSSLPLATSRSVSPM